MYSLLIYFFNYTPKLPLLLATQQHGIATQMGEARANSANAPPPARPPVLQAGRASRNARRRRPQRAVLPRGELVGVFYQSGERDREGLTPHISPYRRCRGARSMILQLCAQQASAFYCSHNPLVIEEGHPPVWNPPVWKGGWYTPYR